MIPEAIVDEVRLRADIVEVIGEHVPLKKAGKDFKARCPFHEEKTPSFYVVPGKGLYHCFGCGESGDIFSFLMKRQGLTFPDAVRAIAVKVGVDVPESAGADRRDEPNAPLLEALAFAADFYRRCLLDAAQGATARAYLERRGLPAEGIERFSLGYAPDAWRALREAAQGHGIADEVLMAAGLIKTSERMEEPYDRLRRRITFPITDLHGRVIGFGGRLLGGSDPKSPKYLNSPETPVYHKGENLYGLQWSRTAIRREGEALVVEGYMDYVSLASRGIENVVAPLGTAMTAEQARLLARYTDRALLLYDSDAAGLRATFRSGDALLAAGVHPLAVTLPNGEDPDSLVGGGGAEALRPYLTSAVDVLERKLEILDEGGWLDDLDGLRTAVDKLLPTLRATTDHALRDLYVARIAERTGVRRETIEEEIRDGMAVASPDRVERRAAGPGQPGATESPPATPAPRGPAAEGQLLMLLLRDAHLVTEASRQLKSEDLDDPVHREIFDALIRSGGVPEAGGAALDLSEPARERLTVLEAADPESLAHGERIFADAVKKIRAALLDRRLDDLDRKLRLARGTPDEEELYRQRAALAAEHKALGASAERQVRRHGRSGRNRP